MPGYTIILHWLFPKGLIKDRRGDITQYPDPKPHSIILLKKVDSDEEAIKIGKNLWLTNFLGKEKRLIINRSDEQVKHKTILEYDNTKTHGIQRKN